MPLNQNYNPKEFEKDIYSQWIDAGVGNPERQMPSNSPSQKGWQSQTDGVVAKTTNKTHSILMPPPNLTGNMHAGHAFGHYAMDTISRLARQRGETDLWFPGVDHAGLQLEGVIDKLIRQGEFDSLLYNQITTTPAKAGTPPEEENLFDSDKTNSPSKKGWQSQTDGVVNRDTKAYMSLPYNPKLKEKAKELRKAGNLSEVILWNEIKGGKMLNLDFDRQKIIGNYIVDFYCASLGIVIEIDGISHDYKGEYDVEREKYLRSLGLEVIHIGDSEVKNNLNDVLERVYNFCESLIKNHLPAFDSTPPGEENSSNDLNSETITYENVESNKPAAYQDIPKEDLPKYLKTNHPDLWLECAWSKVNEWRDNQKTQSAVLGDTPDYSRSLFTLDEQNIEMVNFAFRKYWEDGLIYKGSYLVNWSVGLQTALSDVAGEIDYEKRVDPFVTFEYGVKRSEYSSLELEQKYKDIKLKPFGEWKRPQLSTVRPETKFTDIAIAMHPSKFAIYFNQEIFAEANPLNETFLQDIFDNKVWIYYNLPPLHNGELKLIFTEKVDASFGTGVMKITPAHDPFDYELCKELITEGKLTNFRVDACIGREGKLTAEFAGEFAGMIAQESRGAIFKRLIETGYIPLKEASVESLPLQGAPQGGGVPEFEPVSDQEFWTWKQEKQYDWLKTNYPNHNINWNYEHNVTICERTKTVVEPLISEEFFISYHNQFNWKPINKDDNVSIANRGKTTNLQKLGLEAVNKTNFYSEDYKERGINFLENIKDWCISRDLIWGHKMPVWYNLDTNPKRKFYSFAEYYPLTPLKGELNENFKTEDSNIKPLKGVLPTGAGYQNNHFAISPTKPTTPGNWVQEEKILDTWFSSCLWPLSTLKYPEFVENKKVKANVVLIHGGEVWQDKETYRNKIESGELNWLWYKSKHGSKKTYKSDLKDFCQENNISFIDPQMPNKSNADYTKWKMVFEQSRPFITSETILVGHSLGSMFLTKYLNENEINCKAVFLVSGGLWSESEQNIEDFDTDWGLDSNFSNLKSLGNKVFIVHSKDDKVVEFQRSVELKSKLPDANFVELEGFGHLNIECEELLNIIKDELKPKNKKIFILAGRKAKGTNAFYQHIQREFPSAKLLITPFTDQYSDWQNTVESLRGSLDESSIVITHSMSSLNFCRFMTDNPNIRIKEWHSVGGVFDENLRPDQDEAVTNLVREFLATPIDYEIINQNIESIKIHHSKDDTRVVFENALNYSSKLPKAKLCEYSNYGHFVKEDGLEFPELISLLNNKTDFETFYPTQEMLTAKEIFYQWIIRMTTLSYYFTAEIPYENLIITPTVLDEKGKKMSKSLGNGLEPVAQIDKYSSDALRMAMLGGMIPNRNMKMGGRLADELCEKYRNFGNKMWNVARFFEYQEDKNKEIK
jgi:valyl-tRNA synthetase/very-short-patch-repair endonuclease/predicted alpha/beta hydrolase family esterase